MSQADGETPRDRAVIAALRRRYSHDRDLTVSYTTPNFLRGELVAVDVHRGEEIVGTSFAYVVGTEVVETYTSVAELARWVSNRYRDAESASGFASRPALTFETVAATIAMVITVTICAIVVISLQTGSSIDIPDILSNALTIILGFYFGSQVQQRSTTVPPEGARPPDAH